jgi:hypothetical protein
MIYTIPNKIIVVANKRDNLPEWMTHGKEYELEFDGLGSVLIAGDDNIIHKCELRNVVDCSTYESAS